MPKLLRQGCKGNMFLPEEKGRRQIFIIAGLVLLHEIKTIFYIEKEEIQLL